MTLLVAFFMLCDNYASAQYDLQTNSEKAVEDFAKRATVTLKGKVIWGGQDLSQTTVQVYKDEKLKVLYTGVTRLTGGEFEIRVEPGSY